MNKRYHVLIQGRVQRVYFRANTQRQANALGLTGWVRNLPDGRVEALFEGPESNAVAMRDWCRTGTPPARVDLLEAREESPTGEFTSFDILY
ncbi:MAG: acylphosphatase [Deltaproteobacteria bacterium]|nr:acylphosphatase [Deltaproteobacteria bacterium]